MGPVPKSLRAVANLKRLCEESLDGHCDVQVIDLTEHPSLARSEDIIATPTLIRYSPKPLRRVIGDLSDTERVLARLWS
jgi:circadian clock protein KaiB